MNRRFSVVVLALVSPLIVHAAVQSAEAAPANCGVPASGVIQSAKSLPENSNAVGCGVIGRFVDFGSSTMKVPAPGNTVVMGREFADGGDVSTISTDSAGRLHYSYKNERGRAEAAGASAGTGAGTVVDDCVANGHSEWNQKAYSARSFYMGNNANPPGGSYTSFRAAAIYAADNWEDENSPCYSTDGSAVPAFNYAGTVANDPDMVNSGSGATSCGSSDYVSVVDSGNLGTYAGDEILGLACTWIQYHDGRDAVVNYDIKIDTSDFTWTYDPETNCFGSYDVISVLTHEFGHAIGMSHAAGSANYFQTMHAGLDPCSKYARTLGKGDVLGARTLY